MSRSRILRRRRNKFILGENIAKIVVCSSLTVIKYGFIGLFLFQSYSALCGINDYLRYQKRRTGY